MLADHTSLHFTEVSSCAKRAHVLMAVRMGPLATKVLPRLSTTCDKTGTYLYSLSHYYGLLKLGTGYQGSVTGRLYAQNLEMAVHAGGCITMGAGDRLLLRSPLLPSDQLLLIDAHTLRLVPGPVISLLPASPAPSLGAGGAWDVEFEAADGGCWSSLDTLGDGYVEQVRVVLCSAIWRFGLRLELTKTHCLVLSDEGFVLMLGPSEDPQGFRGGRFQRSKEATQHRVRLKWEHSLLPIKTDFRRGHLLDFVRDPMRLRTYDLASASRSADGHTAEAPLEGTCGDAKPGDSAHGTSRHPLKPIMETPLPTVSSNKVCVGHLVQDRRAPDGRAKVICCEGCGCTAFPGDGCVYVCLDGCLDFRLCHFCQLLGRWSHPAHRSHHRIDTQTPTLR